MTATSRGPRRARLLVSGAVVAAVVTAILVALLVAGLGARAASGPVLFHGLVAIGTAGLAVGFLVLARAGALARDRPERARALSVRCTLAALVVAVVVVTFGVLAAAPSASPLPAWGGVTAGILLVLLVAVALRLRATVRVPRPPTGYRRRSGGDGESEPGTAAGSR